MPRQARTAPTGPRHRTAALPLLTSRTRTIHHGRIPAGVSRLPIRFPRRQYARLQGATRSLTQGRGGDFVPEERAGLDAQVPAARPGDVRAPADAHLG